MSEGKDVTEAIRARVTDWAPDDLTIAGLLNNEMVANPTVQGTVPKPFTFADVMGPLSAASVANIRALPTATALIEAINARDGASVLNWVGALSTEPAQITTEEAQAVQAVVTATLPDPAWPAEIGWSLATVGRYLSSDDVAAAARELSMAIARTTSGLAFLGTDETTGVSVSNNTVSNGSEVDVLGDNASTGNLDLYLVFTSTVTAGSVDVRYNPRRVTGQAYQARSYQWSVAPISGTQKFFLGTIKANRYASVDVNNNGTGASATNVAVLGELTKVS